MVNDSHHDMEDTKPAPLGNGPSISPERIDALLARLDGSGYAPGQRFAIRHYRLGPEIGRGHFGRVYIATDDKLRRKVAIKELSFASHLDLIRLESEAQALARLSHPHVVQVYESGVADATTYFIAMEYIDGPSLAAWLRTAERSLPEILAQYLQIAEGLLAVHRVELVHRDFKPTNVVVASDGRARILDFGIAQAQHTVTPVDPEQDLGRQTSNDPVLSVSHDPRDFEPIADDQGDAEPVVSGNCVVALPVTDDCALSKSYGYQRAHDPIVCGRTTVGAFIGTPAYASPEQFLGEELDARTDQYSFCVSLFQAVYGTLPVPGLHGFEARAEQTIAGQVDWPRETGRAPAWLRKLLRRGLSRKREDRYESFEPIVDELRSRLQPSRRWPWALAATALVIGTSIPTLNPGQQDEPAACGDFSDDLVGLWDDTTREDLRRALEIRTDVGGASLLIRTLDGYAARWQTERRRICEAERVQADVSPDPRIHGATNCLRRHLEDFAVIVDLLHRGFEGEAPFRIDQSTLAEALPIDPRLCAESAASAEEVKRSTGEAVSLVLPLLQQSRVERVFGRYESSAVLASRARDVARQQQHEPLEAASVYHLGVAQSLAGSRKDARASLLDAVVQAEGAGMSLLAVDALAHLVANSVMQQSSLYRVVERDNAEELDLALRLAFAKLDQLQVDDTEIEARVRTAAAHLYNERRDWSRAESEYRAASEILATVRGSDDFLVAGLDINRAAVMAKLDGRGRDAAALADEALGRRVAAMGPAHPLVAQDVDNVARVHKWTGHYDRALEMYQQAIRLFRRRSGPDSADEALALVSIAEVHSRGEDFERAWSPLDTAERLLRGLAPTNDVRARLLRWAEVSKLVANETQQWDRLATATHTQLDILEALRPDDTEAITASAFHLVWANVNLERWCDALALVFRYDLRASLYGDQLREILGSNYSDSASCK